MTKSSKEVERTSRHSLLMLISFAFIFTFVACNKDDDNTPNTTLTFD